MWSGHQEFKELESLIDKIDLIALPRHIFVTEATQLEKYRNKKARLVQTIGVAHNVTSQALEDARVEWKKEIPSAKHYVGVFLGGDAPDSEGKRHYFTAEEAKQLGDFINSRVQGQDDIVVLVTNGPRTGRYDPHSGQEIKDVHSGQFIDATSLAFFEVLQKSNTRYCFEDFVFGQPSAYKAFVRKIQETEGVAFVTGESTSMVSEIGDNLSPGALHIVEVDSMNASHCAHMWACYNADLAHVVYCFDPKKSMVKQEITHQGKKSSLVSAAMTIAQQIKQQLFLYRTGYQSGGSCFFQVSQTADFASPNAVREEQSSCLVTYEL